MKTKQIIFKSRNLRVEGKRTFLVEMLSFQLFLLLQREIFLYCEIFLYAATAKRIFGSTFAAYFAMHCDGKRICFTPVRSILKLSTSASDVIHSVLVNLQFLIKLRRVLTAELLKLETWSKYHCA